MEALFTFSSRQEKCKHFSEFPYSRWSAQLSRLSNDTSHDALRRCVSEEMLRTLDPDQDGESPAFTRYETIGYPLPSLRSGSVSPWN
jgi:hypothetical protein